MQRRLIGFAAGLVLLLCSLAAPGSVFAKAGERAEVSRIRITAVVPATPAPTGACAGTAVHCVILTWVPPTLDTSGGTIQGALTYDVLRSTTSGSGYVKITTAPVSAITFEDDTVTSGKTYFYVVVAYETISGTVSPASSDSTQASAFVPPVTTPNPPTAVTATGH